jgi:hypothetical protein
MAAQSAFDAVQKVILASFDAATDGSDRLRYVPTDDVRPILDARRSSSEEQYQALLRSIFVQK